MKLRFILPLVAALALGGCASGDLPPITPSQTAQAITKVQEIVQQTCSFVVTAGTVTSLLKVWVPAIGMVQDIAQQICAAVNRPAARRFGVPPQVKGVTIQGRFERR